jgi:tetratricopeptide (TPR) repeat protein
MYEMHQQLEQAAAHYEEAAKLDPLNPRLYYHVARVSTNQDRRLDAIRAYQTILDLTPSDLEAIFGLIRLWLIEKQFDQAQQLLAETLERLGPLPELYLMLGLLYREADVPHEALRAFERAVALEETSAQAHFHLGAQLERLHYEQEARQVLRRAITLDPNFADALNYLGYMDAEDGTNLEEAKALIERALALDPENGAYVDSLGWVSYQLSEWDEAIRLLERASQLLDSDPIIFDHLGDAYFKRGDVEHAEAAWQKALELDPTLEAVQRKLDSLLQPDVTAPPPTP